MRMTYNIYLYGKSGELIRDVFSASSMQELGEQLPNFLDGLVDKYIHSANVETVDEGAFALLEAFATGEKPIFTNVGKKKMGTLVVDVTTKDALRSNSKLTVYIDFSPTKLLDSLVDDLAIGISANS